eukprot:6049440-Pleurochrysis_carterae.AAC.1
MFGCRRRWAKGCVMRGCLGGQEVGQHLSETATLKRAAMAATSNTCRPPIIKRLPLSQTARSALLRM